MLVSVAAALQLNTNLVACWWSGVKEGGLMDLSQFALGFLAVTVYRDSPWAIAMFLVPVVIVYFAF